MGEKNFKGKNKERTCDTKRGSSLGGGVFKQELLNKKLKKKEDEREVEEEQQSLLQRRGDERWWKEEAMGDCRRSSRKDLLLPHTAINIIPVAVGRLGSSSLVRLGS